MSMLRFLIVAAALAVMLAPEAGASENALVAARPILAGTTVKAGDVLVGDLEVRGALLNAQEAIGREARLFLPTGRVLFPSDLVAPAMVERNQMVRMQFRRGPLLIEADGRALDRAGVGERVRVMNLDSRSTITATVTGPGRVEAQ